MPLKIEFNQKMATFAIKTLAFILVIVLCGYGIKECNTCKPTVDTEKVHRVYVERVFMNESSRYTFLINGIPKSIDVSCCPSTRMVKIHYDVPPGKPLYYEYTNTCYEGNAKLHHLHIHVRGPADINGGGWNHGKFGKGQTTPIQ